MEKSQDTSIIEILHLEGSLLSRQLLDRLIKHSIYKGVRERKLKFDREEASVISVNIKPIITPGRF